MSEASRNLRFAVRGAALCAGAIAFLVTVDSAAAQDEFGRMVAVSGGTVIVGKPGPARGPAALYRFERDRSGTWVLAGTFSPPETAENGWRLAPSLQWSGGRLAVGSADPDVRIGAHIFQDARDGFAYDAGLELPRPPEPEPAAAGPGGAAVDFAGIMRILQPAARGVAVERERVAVSVASDGTTPGGVHVFQQGARGWGFPTILPPPGPESEFPDFGAAMALRRDDVIVSSPGAGEVGQVFVYRPADDPLGNITVSPADSLEAGARFGAALAVDGSHLLVGAPGARQGSGLVFAYRRFEPGDWELRQVLATGAPDQPTGAFGTTLAILGDELWVGAPLARDGSGEVHRFRLIDGSWEPAPLDLPEAGRGAALGSAIAVGTTVAVLGAPGTDGGYGAAMVFTRELGGPWGEPEWLRPGGGLDAVTEGEVLCEEGAAAGFSCESVDLLAFLPTSAIGAEPWERVSDIWGWMDPETGREYALVGRSGGAAIIDVTDPAAPRYVGVVTANPSGARDLKVYADHLFFTGDGAGDHGLVVFDLTRVRDTSGEPPSPNGGVAFEPDAVYRGIASAHNLVMDAESGFAFPVGSSGGGETCGGGLHMVDVRDPKAPVFAGCFTDDVGLIAPGRTHDAQCVVYRGPDERYQGRQVCFISNESLLRIVDITDKETPTPIGGASHPGVAYIHQGWLTEDHRYYYLDDELDELVGTAPATRTYIYDVAELDDPILVGSVDGPTAATDHNLYVKGDRMYQANYQAGFRLFDISDPEAPEEIGWFDTTPYEGDPPGFVGAWTAYPFFESGTVVVTSIYEGVFLLRPRPRQLIP
ncbi:MAG: choice-of-anchor B family protein [Gemmatimonadetes bacterium]|nr:choice-of-anchor B family protein [Gemmatimonadota bacterium]MXX73060.1 choice-of-anchor B family protein [Gemmatimonadota bacterium]MYC90601.1 choice-of-anchor B family protein [Gemmatimonadota bacterium]MYG34352.1 choice-of-anchor B family protein [Gemmatimonadota bacterium]